MSEFFSKLGIGVDSTQVKTGKDDLDKFSKSAGDAEKSADKLSAGATNMGRNIGLAAAAGVAAFAGLAGKIISATSEQEAAQAQLASALKNVGDAAGASLADLTEKATALQAATTFDDEAIVGSMTRLITITGGLGENMDRATKSVLNMATRMGGDLDGAALQVGKALAGTAEGITALSRSGVVFTAAEKEMHKALVESGKAAEAQEIILGKLEAKFGGAAAAARDTLGGAVKGLKNAFSDLFEAGGTEGADKLKSTLNDLANTLSDPAVKEGAATIASSIVSLVNAIVSAPGEIATFVEMLRNFAGAELFGSETTGNLATVEREIEVLREKLGGLTDDLGILQNAGLSSTREGFLNAKAITETTARIAFLTAESKRLIGAMETAAPAAKAATASIDELGSKGEPSVKKVTVALTDQEKAWADLNEKLVEKIALFGKEGEEAQLSAKIQLGIYGKLSDAEKDRVLALARVADEQVRSKKAAEDLAKASEDYRKSTDALIRQSLPEQEQQLMAVREAMLKLNLAAEQFPERAAEINKAIANLADDEAEILRGSTEQLSSYGEQAARNIQDAFAEFLFNPFEDGLDGMLSSFIGIIKTMVSQAAAADISAAIGLPGAGAGGNLSALFGALGGVGGIGGESASSPGGLAGISGAGALLPGLGSAILNGTSAMAMQGGLVGSVGLGLNNFANSLLTPGSMGAGLLGALGAQAIFGGPNSGALGGIGSAIGFAAGGPVGAVIGGAAGGALGTLGGDGKNKTLFAGVTAGNNAGFEQRTSGSITAASGLELSAVSRRLDDGGKLANDMLAQFADLDSVLTQGVQRLGGTVNLSGKSLGGSGLKGGSSGSFFGSAQDVSFDPSKLSGASVDFVRAWIAEVSTTLDAGLAASLNSIKGSTVDELLAGFNVEIQRREIPRQLKDALGAQEQAQKAISNATRTATEIFGDQVAEVYRLTDAYDGSIESHNALVSALQTEQATAEALGIALSQASDQISVIIGGLRNTIEESMLSEDALYARRKSQVDDLVASLNTATDPAVILDTVRQIEALSATVWQSLAKDQQAAMGEGFLSFLDGVEKLGQDRIAAAFGNLDTTANGIFNAVSAAMDPASAAAIEAANINAAASNQILESANIFNAASVNMIEAARAFANARASGGGEVVYQ